MCLTLTNCLTFLGVNAKAKENKRTFDAAKYKLLKSNEDTHFEKFENSGYTVLSLRHRPGSNAPTQAVAWTSTTSTSSI